MLKDVIYFLGRARNYDFIPQESEIAQIKWVEMSLAHSFLSYDNDKQLVNRAPPADPGDALNAAMCFFYVFQQ